MQMKKENNLVRQLSASETMGGAHEICTDKTGTLTLNQMTVKQLYINDGVVDAAPGTMELIGAEAAQVILESVVFNISARVELDPVTNEYITKGNCTERGLLHFFMACDSPVADMAKIKDDRTLEVIPFNSSRKRATTAIDHPTIADTVRVFCKGAPEIVMEYCDTMFINGDKADLSS